MHVERILQRAHIQGVLATAAVHRDSGLRAVTGEHYSGGHWLGSFAVYLVTGRGLPVPKPDAAPLPAPAQP